jgi:hypothetical protein
MQKMFCDFCGRECDKIIFGFDVCGWCHMYLDRLIGMVKIRMSMGPGPGVDDTYPARYQAEDDYNQSEAVKRIEREEAQKYNAQFFK